MTTFAAGDEPTAAQLNQYAPKIVVQVADTSPPVNNSTTLVNDDGMVFALEANTRYVISGRVVFNSGATPDIKIGWTYPAGVTLNYSLTGYSGGAFSSSGPYTQTSTPAMDGGASDDEFMIRGVVTVSSTAGNLQLQYAQNTANASNTVIKAGTDIMLQMQV